MPDPNRMRDIVSAKYRQTLEEAMPRLITEFKTPDKLAMHLGVYAGSPRHWLVKHGWHYDKGSKSWRKGNAVEHV